MCYTLDKLVEKELHMNRILDTEKVMSMIFKNHNYLLLWYVEMNKEIKHKKAYNKRNNLKEDDLDIIISGEAFFDNFDKKDIFDDKERHSW